MILIYITCKDREEAKKLSKILLEKRLIACSNLFPVESMYWWKGKIEDQDEYALIAKSTEDKFNKIKETVKQNHSYDIPCIEMIKTSANKRYEEWVKEETRQ
ncbi:MAG: divalent-cation tolerance protein CutA [Candidatus Woesearchaeota archaeon]